jgi:hypothetical protein
MLGGPQGRNGGVGKTSRLRDSGQPVASRYTDCAIRPTYSCKVKVKKRSPVQANAGICGSEDIASCILNLSTKHILSNQPHVTAALCLDKGAPFTN